MSKYKVQRWSSAFLSAALLFGFTPLVAQEQARPFDTVIMNGHVIDGTGSPWFSGDVGIRGGKIVAIGNLTAAARIRTIDAHGLLVAPGFIDAWPVRTYRSR
jgi:adenine deaminase